MAAPLHPIPRMSDVDAGGRGPMRIRLAATATTAVVLVGFLGAPVFPVLFGVTMAYAWLLWRGLVSR
jgi:hypothetical protein